MTVSIQSNNMFTPNLINDVFSKMKNKALDITGNVLLKTSAKMINIAKDELFAYSQNLELVLEELTIEEIKELNPTAFFQELDGLKDKLLMIHDELENSKEPYEVLLFDVVDETLDYITKLINMLMYLNSKLTRDNFKVA